MTDPTYEEAPKELVTVNTIIGYLKDAVENKIVVRPSVWIDAAQKLVILMGDETDLLFEMQRKIADIKITMMNGQEKINVSEVKLRIEAQPEWVLMRKQEAKIKQIEEFIRICKIQARMKDSEYRNQ